MPNSIFTDRSRIEVYQRCPRKRWLEYHQDGRGVTPAKTPLPLAVGGSVHAGLAELLASFVQHPEKAEDLCNGLMLAQMEALEDQAVGVALADFQQYTRAGLELDAFERAQMGPAQARAISQDGSTFEQQLVAQARAMGMSDAEVAQYEAALRQSQTRGAGDFEKYLEAEQYALVEAMVRAYARRRLRPLLEQFEVLEVEREGEWKLSEWPETEYKYECECGSVCRSSTLCGACGSDQTTDRTKELWFMSRPDALLRERSSNQLYLLSFKTTSQWDKRKEADAQHDMQGLSEGVEVEQRLANWWRILHNGSCDGLSDSEEVNEIGASGYSTPSSSDIAKVRYLRTLSSPPRVLGVRYEFLLKGERWKDKDLALRFGMDNVRAQKTPLLRRYVAHSLPKRGESAFNLGDVCWSYDYIKDDGMAGSLYYGHWKSHNVFEGGGRCEAGTLRQASAYVGKASSVKQWIDALDASAESMSGYDPTVGLPPRNLGWKGPAQTLGYTAQHPLDTVFVPPITVTRNDDDLRDLFESAEAQERRVAEAVAQINGNTDEGERRSLINQHFPMFRKSCEYPSQCAFVGLCYAANTDLRDRPLESGMFKARVPNHPQEGKQ